MARVKGGYTTRRRRKKILKQAKGYYGAKHLLFRTAKEQVMNSLAYAYRDRKNRKRDFRKLWIVRINAAVRNENMSYSQFMNGLKIANINLNRKMLADLATNHEENFKNIVIIVKNSIEKLAKTKNLENSHIVDNKNKTTIEII